MYSTKYSSSCCTLYMIFAFTVGFNMENYGIHKSTKINYVPRRCWLVYFLIKLTIFHLCFPIAVPVSTVEPASIYTKISPYKLFIHSHFCRTDFEELFDIIITNALKPGFFSLVPQQRPFRTLGE